jgi:hypothetical protein
MKWFRKELGENESRDVLGFNRIKQNNTMTVENRIVLVGIRIDSQSRQLLNWAIIKVAQPGDCVIAIHVVKTKTSGNKFHNLYAFLIFPLKYCHS